MISYLQIENLTKSFGDRILFENISLGIGEGDRIGLIAKNGAGKTTLLNILAGKENYDSGNIVFRNNLRVGYLEQSPSYPPELTVIQACFQSDNDTVRLIAEYEQALQTDDPIGLQELLDRMDHYKAWDYEQRAKQILSQLKINNFDQPVKELYILDEATKHNMKIFMSSGWAKDQDDNLLDPAIKERQLRIMEELASLYKNHKAFYGWYLPVEDCLCPIFAEHAVQSVNTLSEKAKKLAPGKKTLISPYGIGLSEFDNPEYEKQMQKLKVDIIAYQDEVGCVRDQFTLPRLKKNWQRLRDIHNRLNIEMWANCETFTWEEGTNDRTSALIPAAYPRLLSQQVAASAAGVDKIISFMFYGIIENPESKYQLGQPVWSNKVYTDYMDGKNGKENWKLMEAAFMEKLVNGGPPERMLGKAGLQRLRDGKVAEEDSKDARWVKFEAGYHEFVVDLQKKTRVQKAMLRMLNYNPEKIGMPMKTYLYTSIDGKEYNLSSIKDAPYFPNNKHDAWIESILFDQLDENVRYVKVAFEAPQQVYIDELFINPVLK